MAKFTNFSTLGLLLRGNLTPLVDSSLTPKSISYSSTISGCVDVAPVANLYPNAIHLGYIHSQVHYAAIADSATYELGSGNFTIGFWLYTTSIGGADLAYVSKGPSIGPSSILVSNKDGNIVFSSASNSGSWDLAQNKVIGAPSTNAWHYIEIDRSGNDWYTFLDGVQGSTWNQAGTVADFSNELCIGAFYKSTDGYFAPEFYMQDFFILPGIALHTSGFTPNSYPIFPATLAGNITESLAITKWEFFAIDLITKLINGSGITAEDATTYSVDCLTTNPTLLTCSPHIDYVWSASKTVTLNEYCIPTNPLTTGKLYKATSIGSSPHHTGGSEPTWTSPGTVSDGDITWTYVADLVTPLALGPRIPS